jgi:phage-related protein
MAKLMRGSLRDVVEIVAIDADGRYRLMYTVKLGEAVYVLHAFQKKSKREIATPKNELELIELRVAYCEDQAWKPRSLRAN